MGLPVDELGFEDLLDLVVIDVHVVIQRY